MKIFYTTRDLDTGRRTAEHETCIKHLNATNFYELQSNVSLHGGRARGYDGHNVLSMAMKHESTVVA